MMRSGESMVSSATSSIWASEPNINALRLVCLQALVSSYQYFANVFSSFDSSCSIWHQMKSKLNTKPILGEQAGLHLFLFTLYTLEFPVVLGHHPWAAPVRSDDYDLSALLKIVIQLVILELVWRLLQRFVKGRIPLFLPDPEAEAVVVATDFVILRVWFHTAIVLMEAGLFLGLSESSRRIEFEPVMVWLVLRQPFRIDFPWLSLKQA